jgi:hypothetical protein
MSAFKPKRIEDPPAEPTRPTSAEIAATIGPLAAKLISTTPNAPPAATPVATARPEPTLMMSFKASKSFAKMLAEAAEPEGGLRRLIARVFAEAGYPVPEVDRTVTRKRRTYD